MKAFEGVADECGQTDVFAIYKQHVDEKKSKRITTLFKDHYDVPIHLPPNYLLPGINKFYHAKYGMFTCHDGI